MRDIVFGLLMLPILAAAAPVEAATYTVSKSGSDGNSCASAQGTSQNKQKKTITAGLRCLTRPGDILLIHEGTYEETLFEKDFGTTGVSWNAFMTVAASPREAVVLRVPAGGDNAIRFQNGTVRYVEIEGLVVDGTGGGTMSTLVALGVASHHLRFRNVEIRNSQGNGMLAAGSSHEFVNLNVHHNGLNPGYLQSNGMYMTTDNSVIAGGQFHDNECFGIRFWDSDPGQKADNNIIDGARIYGNGAGIGLSGASVCGSDGGGVTLADVGNTVKNSVIFGNVSGIRLFDFKASSNSRIYNNTITKNRVFGLSIPPGSSSTVYANNIICNNGVADLSDKGSGSVAITNLLTDPGFTAPDADDYTLKPGSAARDAGTTVATVMTDYAGTGRPQGLRYDVGAYELPAGTGTPAKPGVDGR